MLGRHKVCAVIPAAGSGRRMGAGPLKQFIRIGGKELIIHTLQQFQACREVDSIIVAAGAGSIPLLTILLKRHRLSKVTGVIAGGSERQDSVWNCLRFILHERVDLVMVHDAVRPFVEGKLIREVLEAALKYSAAIAAVRPTDTLKTSPRGLFATGSPARERLWLAQTPQAFRFSLLFKAYEKAMNKGFYGTDDACLVERIGRRVRIVEGSYDNIKITTRRDIELARLIRKRGVKQRSAR